MRESKSVAGELRRSVSGPAWHGPALSELLAGIDGEAAAMSPAHTVHTIHELVLHIITWQEIASGVLRGEAVPDLPFPSDWPDMHGRDWAGTLDHLLTSNQALVHAVAGLSDEQLERTVPGRDYSVYVLLHGVAQHNAYHGGQIALLKKLIQPRAS